MKYVIALSKTLNFTKAASAMCTTQPAFSRVISSAEDELGMAIFERNRRYVRLTEAGVLLVERLKQIIRLYEEGVADAQLIGREYRGKLRVGYVPDTVNDDIRKICGVFAEKLPDEHLILKETFYYELLSNLSSEDMDIVVFTAMRSQISDEYECYPMYETPLCAIVNEAHPLADRSEVYPRELTKEPFIVLAHDTALSGGWNFVHRFAQEHGFTPHIADTATMLSSAIFKVSCGIGITISSQLAGDRAPENVRIIKIANCEPCFRYAMWNGGRVSPALTEFIRCIKEQYPAPVNTIHD